MTRSQGQGLMLLLLAVLLWSTVEVVIRDIHHLMGPILLAWIRFALGTILLLVLLPFELKRKKLRLNRQIIMMASWLCILGIVICAITLQYALKFAGAGVVATVYGTSPLMVFILSWLLLSEPLTKARFIGVLLGFIGIVVLSSSQPSETFSFIGLGLILLNIFCFATFTVLIKKWAGPYAGLPITALCFLFGSIYMTPMALLEGDRAALEYWQSLFWPVLYLGIGCTGLAYLFYFMGIERVDATQGISVILLKPPLATALAAVVLDEPITWNLVGALVLILSGLLLVYRENISHRNRVVPRAT